MSVWLILVLVCDGIVVLILFLVWCWVSMGVVIVVVLVVVLVLLVVGICMLWLVFSRFLRCICCVVLLGRLWWIVRVLGLVVMCGLNICLCMVMCMCRGCCRKGMLGVGLIWRVLLFLVLGGWWLLVWYWVEVLIWV